MLRRNGRPSILGLGGRDLLAGDDWEESFPSMYGGRQRRRGMGRRQRAHWDNFHDGLDNSDAMGMYGGFEGFGDPGWDSWFSQDRRQRSLANGEFFIESPHAFGSSQYNIPTKRERFWMKMDYDMDRRKSPYETFENYLCARGFDPYIFENVPGEK